MSVLLVNLSAPSNTDCGYHYEVACELERVIAAQLEMNAWSNDNQIGKEREETHEYTRIIRENARRKLLEMRDAGAPLADIKKEADQFIDRINSLKPVAPIDRSQTNTLLGKLKDLATQMVLPSSFGTGSTAVKTNNMARSHMRNIVKQEAKGLKV